MRNFVNPANLPVRGDVSEFDFLFFKVGYPDERCDDELLNLIADSETFGEEYGSDSMCAMSTLSLENETEEVPRCYRMDCDKDNNLKIQISGETQSCQNEGDAIQFTGFVGTVICPKPELICGMKLFLHGSLQELPPMPDFPNPTQLPSQPLARSLSWWNIALPGIILLLVIIGAAYLRFRRHAPVVEALANEYVEPPRTEPKLDIPIPDENLSL
jgi:hypothetical protein